MQGFPYLPRPGFRWGHDTKQETSSFLHLYPLKVCASQCLPWRQPSRAWVPLPWDRSHMRLRRAPSSMSRGPDPIGPSTIYHGTCSHRAKRPCKASSSRAFPRRDFSLGGTLALAIHSFLKPVNLPFPLATWRWRTFSPFKYGLKCHHSPGDLSPEPAAGLAIVVS